MDAVSCDRLGNLCVSVLGRMIYTYVRKDENRTTIMCVSPSIDDDHKANSDYTMRYPRIGFPIVAPIASESIVSYNIHHFSFVE